MDIRSLLQANHDAFLELHSAQIGAVLTLQHTLIRDILPSVADELELDTWQIAWLQEWLQDTGECSYLCYGRSSFTSFTHCILETIFQISRVSLNWETLSPTFVRLMLLPPIRNKTSRVRSQWNLSVVF
jgi:hypothetical protein